MSITLTTTPLSEQDILVSWSYSTFNEATNVEISSDGISYAPISGSPFALGTNSAVASGLTGATKYWFRIKKTVWVGYTKKNDDSITNLAFKTGLRFDGVNDHVYTDLNAVPYPDLNSFSFWVRFDQPVITSGGSNIFTSYTGVPEYWYVQEIPTNPANPSVRTLVLIMYNSVGGNQGITVDIPNTVGVWFNLVGTIEKTSTDNFTFKLAYNNVLSTLPRPLPEPVVITHGDFYFAANGLGSGAGINVVIDQFVLVKDFDLTTITSQIYNNGAGVDLYQLLDPSNVIFYYDFDEADDDVSGNGGGGDNTGISAPELVDRSGNGHTGTLQNFTKNGATSNWVDNLIDSGLDVFSVTPLSTTSITFTVDANPTSLDVEFEYSKLADFSVIDGSGSTTTSVAVTGLDPATLYYFRAKNTGMTGYFKIESATTL